MWGIGSVLWDQICVFHHCWSNLKDLLQASLTWSSWFCLADSSWLHSKIDYWQFLSIILQFYLFFIWCVKLSLCSWSLWHFKLMLKEFDHFFHKRPAALLPMGGRQSTILPMWDLPEATLSKSCIAIMNWFTLHSVYFTLLEPTVELLDGCKGARAKRCEDLL